MAEYNILKIFNDIKYKMVAHFAVSCIGIVIYLITELEGFIYISGVYYLGSILVIPLRLSGRIYIKQAFKIIEANGVRYLILHPNKKDYHDVFKGYRCIGIKLLKSDHNLAGDIHYIIPSGSTDKPHYQSNNMFTVRFYNTVTSVMLVLSNIYY